MSLYAYIAPTGRKVVDSINLTFTGVWSSTTAYTARMVANDAAGHYWVALVDNTNVSIPTVFDATEYATWSHLVLIEEEAAAGPVVTGDWLQDVWNGTNYSEDLFDRAYALAQTGTDAAAAATALANEALALAGTNSAGALLPLIQQAYNLGVAGTTAANSADLWGRDAFSIAVDGTNTANSADLTARAALEIASSGTTTADSADLTARIALRIAVDGTNSANAADLQGRLAYSLGVAGTTAADSADLWGRDAFSIAVDGTNSANNAGAIASTALSTAWVGTNAADRAYSIAKGALNTAWVGTNVADQAYAVATTALDTAWTGTGIGGQAYSIATEALDTAWTGTDAANQAYSLAVNALNTAWVGTNAIAAITASGTSGQILRKNSETSGDTRWADLVEYGTLLPSTGTVTLDLSSATPRLRSIAVSAPTSFATTNVSAGNWISVRMSTNGTASTIRFGENWTWLGSSYSGDNSLASGKYAMLSLTCFGQSQTDIVAAWVAQS